MNSRNFFAELKRRNVYKVAVAYAVAAWLLIQAASILFPTFEAPGWVMKVFVTAVAAGFPIALILAWAFELTPELSHRDEVQPEAEAMLAKTAKDKWRFPRSEEVVARAYAGLGDVDRAIPLLTHALTAPCTESLTSALLRLDPFSDPLRNDHRFKKLANAKP